MSAITPSTNVKLLRVPIELDNENQLTFANATAQYGYFNSLPNSLSVDNFTYQRKDGVIRYPGNVDSLWQYNYVMYQNEGFSNKWFYAYIDKMEFVNPNCTNIYIRTDPFQTWQFDLEYKQSFIEREHVNDDTIGKHTVPENIETGDYICSSNGDINVGGSTIWYAVGTSEIVGTFTDSNSQTSFPTHKINGVGQGLNYVFFDNPSDIPYYLKSYAAESKSDAVYSIFTFPVSILRQSEAESSSYSYKTVSYEYSGHSVTVTIGQCYLPTVSTNESELISYARPAKITKPTNFYYWGEAQFYTPRNKKLLTFPYCYLNITNNNGTTVNYHFEDFYDQTYAKFGADGAFCPGCSIKFYPIQYKQTQVSDVYTDTTNSYLYGVNLGKYPALSWNSDQYTNWLTQNGVNVGISTLTSAATAAVGVGMAVTGNVPGGILTAAGGLSGVANSLASVYKASLMPDQAKGDINAGDLMMSKNNNSISYYIMMIKPEYAAIIDSYFDRYGYKVNITKTPNITGRTNWNYVKTIGCKIHGYIPTEDLDTIMQMFDNGVTFWHNPATFLDYSQSNAII